MLFTPLESSAPSGPFTYPFLYEVSHLSELAVKKMSNQLPELTLGNMFGVLVVENQIGQVGYISGFSGASISQASDIEFVPRLISSSREKAIIDHHKQLSEQLELQVQTLASSAELKMLNEQLTQLKQQAHKEVSTEQKRMGIAKKKRKKVREQAELEGDFSLVNELNQQSIDQKLALKQLKLHWQYKIENLECKIDFILNKISSLKSCVDKEYEHLIYDLKAEFKCSNKYGERKSLNSLQINDWGDDAGDEVIVKLLNYAFVHDLIPISFAQFWWGPSPESEVRHHGRIYPVSQTKTKSILNHLLAGITLEADPLLTRLNRVQHCKIIFQDADLVVIDKPVDLLSVPGTEINNSVYSHMKDLFPEATGPLIVHRLDMATSGLMVVALNKHTHKHLQKQFIQRSVKKRYVAVLNGYLNELEGVIKLPLRPDLTDRPRQVVCEQYGRYAETSWQVISYDQNKTRVYFYPKTGRSHQLRMHAAHQHGLAMPIVGDDLYGVDSAERLQLHADLLGFVHPVNNEEMLFQLDADF